MHNGLADQIRQLVEEAMKAEGVGARRFEEMRGLKPWALRGLLDPERKQAPSIDKAKEIADALGLELYLGPPRQAAESVVSADFVHVPVHKAMLAAGGGANNDSEDIVDHLAFRRSWLKRMSISPANAVIARAKGDSMWPTIHDGDAVLIDRRSTEPPAQPKDRRSTRPAPIYGLLDNGEARIKRVVLADPDTLVLLSDNPSFPPDFRSVSAVKIIGRVRWWGHTEGE